MQYLKIENKGVAPIEGFTHLGCSTSRFSSNEDVSGQFGSGLKHAVNLLLERGLDPSIYSDMTGLHFYLEDMEVNDGYGGKIFKEVCVHITCSKPLINKKMKLVRTLDHGSLDWTDVSMACREFVSNALDRCTKDGDEGEFSISLVEENQVRAKKGYTRVFLPFEGDIIKFYMEINKRFLNLKGKTPIGVLEKANRGLNGNGAMIYRLGIWVKQTEEYTPSLFDYNLGKWLRIDECRNSNDSDVTSAATLALLLHSSAEQKIKFIKQLVSDKSETSWEECIGEYAAKMVVCYNQERFDAVKPLWKAAWDAVASDGMVLTDRELPKQAVMMRGLQPVYSKSHGWYWLATKLGFKTAANLLTEDELVGKEFFNPEVETLYIGGVIWKWLEDKNLTEGKVFPEIEVYSEPGVSKKHGYYQDNKVFINKEIEGSSELLKSVMLEEMIHYVTGYEDYCHAMQTFLFNTLAKEIK